MRRQMLFAAGAAGLLISSAGARVLYEGTDPSGSKAPSPAEAEHAQVEMARERLEICVQASPKLSVDLAALKPQLEIAAAAAVASPAGTEHGLGSYPLEVHLGCPHGYVPPPADIGRDPALPTVRGPVDEPLEISTLVFLVGDDEARLLEPHGIGRVGYEEMCDGKHTCWEVTTALYVSPSLLGNQDRLLSALIVGMGIGPPPGAHPEGRPPEWTSPPKPGDGAP